MSTTMKKAEILSAAKSNVIDAILPEGARQIGAATYAIPTEVDGVTCWVKVACACGDWEEERERKEREAAEKAAEKERKAAEKAAKKKA